MLETQVNSLKYEIETMDNKKHELSQRIAESKEAIIRLELVLYQKNIIRISLDHMR